MSESNVTEAPDAMAALDALFKDLNRSDLPGLVVGVAQHGRVLYRRGLGLASLELGVANSPATRMRIGSTSKHFACLAVLLLAEDGLVDIDAGIRTWVPELPLLEGDATLRQLMTHTGGYRCFLDLGFIADGMAIKPAGEALAAQVRQRAVNFAPGDNMIYCNGGYHLLSLVVARVSGLSYEDFVAQRIFQPLGMHDTESVPSDFEMRRGVATLHVPLPGGGYRRGMFPSEEVRGEGAMISTVDDMLRWLAHLRGPKVVGSEASWSRMLERTRLNNGSENPYALGLMRHAYRGVEVIHHAGAVMGGTSQMLTVPGHALDIVILANGALAKPTDLANRVVDIVLGDATLGPVEAKATPERFGAVVGARYVSPRSGLVVGFGEVDGKFGLAFLNSPVVPLRDEGDTLRIGFEDIAIGPLQVATAQLADRAEAPARIELREAGTPWQFERLPQEAPALADVAGPLLGRYRCDDLDADAHVRWSGEALHLVVKGPFATNALVLEAFSSDVFGFSANSATLPLRGTVRAERDGARVARLVLDTARSRHVVFGRAGD